jgi:hypothetical protein
MRRVLVLLWVCATCLLGTAASLAAAAASAAPVARVQQEIERTVQLEEIHAEGFGINLGVDNNDGEVTATLIVSRGPQVAYYTVMAQITAQRVTARFGKLGELDYTYKPLGGGSTRCLGAPTSTGEAEFDGTFTFTGEEGYVHVDADHATGNVGLYPTPRGCGGVRRSRRAVPYQPTYSDKGASLNATAGSRSARLIRAVDIFDGGGKARHRAFMSAIVSELREGMSVSRGVTMPIPSGAFHWNLDAGSASVDPPAPFTGSARFTQRDAKGHGVWTGSLGMPIFGGEPVELAGSAFRASIHKGVPQDE